VLAGVVVPGTVVDGEVPGALDEGALGGALEEGVVPAAPAGVAAAANTRVPTIVPAPRSRHRLLMVAAISRMRP